MNVPQWLQRWTADRAVRAGVIGAAWSVAPSYARGLLPRSAVDQAAATAVVATLGYQLTATTWSTVEAVVAGRPGHVPGPRALLAGAAGACAIGFGTQQALRRRADDSLVAAGAFAAARTLANAGIAGTVVMVGDQVLHRVLRRQVGLHTTLLADVLGGAALAGVTVLSRQQRAARYGLVDPERRAVMAGSPVALARAGAVGAATAVSLVGLALAEQTVARATAAGLAELLGEPAGAAGEMIGHGVALTGMGVAGAVALTQVRRRISRRDDVVEPAYPAPPTSRHVSAGPRSGIGFDTIGKEGRRFVLMALTAADITRVMGEPARDPVRVVAGYEAAPTVAGRTALALADLEALGGYERGLIMVAAPTGVGYVNYVVAEALEYLTRGDCAIVVPQYALSPSALALGKTNDGVELQRAVLAGIRDRVASLPADRRPRVVQFGESLGAQVALDVAGSAGTAILPALGLDGGLYLGVPFRSRTWELWRESAHLVDPEGRLTLVAEPSQLVGVPTSGRHVLVVHDDDPVNKFSYEMVVQRPWWLGAPATRPAKVPRETSFRPVVSFVLALVDLKNGMNSKPGEFVRRGHDYRIDAREALQRTFGLPASAAQVTAIEAALREREQAWAARRLVSRKLDEARRSIARTLNSWGQSAVPVVAEADPESLVDGTGRSIMGSVPWS